MRHEGFDPQEKLFRIWVGAYVNWQPAQWSDVPPEVVTVEPADDGLFSADEAMAFLEGFNSQMLLTPRGRWAVAIPVEVHYSGDAEPGQRLARPQVALTREFHPAEVA